MHRGDMCLCACGSSATGNSMRLRLRHRTLSQMFWVEKDDRWMAEIGHKGEGHVKVGQQEPKGKRKKEMKKRKRSHRTLARIQFPSPTTRMGQNGDS